MSLISSARWRVTRRSLVGGIRMYLFIALSCRCVCRRSVLVVVIVSPGRALVQHDRLRQRVGHAFQPVLDPLLGSLEIAAGGLRGHMGHAFAERDGGRNHLLLR